MRFPLTALALAALVILAGCGDDEPEDVPVPRPAATQRPVVDTTLGDTMAPGGQGAANQPGQPGEAGQAGAPTGGQAGQGQTAGTSQDAAGAQTGAAAPDRASGSDRAPEAGTTGSGPSGQRMYTVQVAAFTSPDSARKWMGRLNSLDLPVWTSTTELGGTTYYRLRVGAVSSVPDARRLGALMTQRFEWPVWVAPITAADRMPDDAVASTRRVLGGS